MDINEVKEYLGMIIDAEQNYQAQNQSLNTLKNKLNNCNTEKNEAEKKLSCFVTPQKENAVTWGISSFLASIFASVLLGGGLFLVLFIFLESYVPVSILFTIACIATIILFIFYIMHGTKERENKYQKNLDFYNEQVGQIKLTISSLETKISYLKSQISILNDTIEGSEKNLKKLHECTIVHPKYQTLQYAVLLYDCLDTRRADKLEGPDGAYNRIELDYRLDNISAQLETIIRRLGDIRNILSDMRSDMSLLNGAIKSVDDNITLLNQNTENGNQLLRNLEEKSDLLRYQQERVAREVEYANRINYLMGRNNVGGIFEDNRPPHMGGY